MRKLRKLGYLFLILNLTGCGSKLAMEDYIQTNPSTCISQPIMETDYGYYYNSSNFNTLSLHYYDKNSEKTIFLCNKPECMHKGNELCAATNSIYHSLCTGLYDNHLYITSFKEEDRKQSYQLLRASLNGSELTEVCTYLNFTGHNELAADSELVLHRGKAFITYKSITDDTITEYVKMEYDTQAGKYGLVMIDLATNQCKTLMECDLPDTKFIADLNAYGDKLFFNVRTGFKTSLYQYDISTGETTQLDLVKNYQGKYAVVDDNTIAYLRDGVFLYHIDTGKSDEFKAELIYEFTFQIPDADITGVNEVEYSPLEIMSYDGYLILCDSFIYQANEYVTKMPYDFMSTNYHIVTLEGEEVAIVNHKVEPNEWLMILEAPSLKIVNGTCYLESKESLRKCSFSDLLNGKEDWMDVLDYEIVEDERNDEEDYYD